MATIKREINKTTTKSTTKTAKKSTKKVAGNAFKLDEKSMTLTLTLPVEWNTNHSMLKAVNLEKVEGKEYQQMVFIDDTGNKVFLFKTGFNYESLVKEKTIAKNKLDTSKLSDDEQKVLELLLKKMSK